MWPERGYEILSYLSAFSVLVPVCMAFYFLRHVDRISLILLVYLLISLAVELVQFTFIAEGRNTITVINYFSFSEFLLIALIYHYALRLRRYTGILFVMYVLIVAFVFFISNHHNTITVFNGFYMFSIILFALIYFYKESREYRVERVVDYNFFWFNSAFLIYFGFSFFIFLYHDFMLKVERNIALILSAFHLLMNLIYYGILSVGIWKTSGKQR